MTDYFLKTSDKETMLALLEANGIGQPAYEDDDGNEVKPDVWQGPLFAVDLLSTLYTRAEYDAEGNQLTPPLALEGYHANVRWLFRDAPEFGAASVQVSTPFRLFG